MDHEKNDERFYGKNFLILPALFIDYIHHHFTTQAPVDSQALVSFCMLNGRGGIGFPVGFVSIGCSQRDFF
jgi:hypothetical protein